MDWHELKRRRSHAIVSMQLTLDNATPLGLNPVFVFVLGLPVLAWQMFTGALGILTGTLIGMTINVVQIVFAPFLALYLIVDLFLIALWFLKAIAVKSGR